jgi:hypothetical protein
MWEGLRQHFEAVETDGDRWIRASCKHCAWTHCANTTRMKNHYFLRHAALEQEALSDVEVGDSEAAEDQPKKKKKFLQTSMVAYSDLAFTKQQQTRSEANLVLLQIEHSIPFSALEGPAMQQFCRTLRSDFVVPSRRTLQRRLSDLYQNVWSKAVACDIRSTVRAPRCQPLGQAN